METLGFKKIQGRRVDLVAVDKVRKHVKLAKKQTSAHIYLPRQWEGFDVDVILISPKPFICSRCSVTIMKEENFSPEKGLCSFCYREKKALKENKCVICKGPNPKKEQWAQCDKCFNMVDEDEEKEEEATQS